MENLPTKLLKGVDVMDEIVYNVYKNYFDVLEKTGYMALSQSEKLLVLAFYKDFVFQDYRGLLSVEDYSLIEKALDCLYGSSCLIPYPDYLKMGKLHLGEVTELASRTRVIENTKVIKSKDVMAEFESELDIDEYDKVSDK